MEIKKYNFKIEQIKTVPIVEVQPNGYNPKEKDTEEFKKVVESIRLKGLRTPIIVREKNNQYEIIDGEQRYTACKELGYTQILIYNEGEVSDKEAKELTIWYQQQVPFDQIQLADLIKDLSQYPDLELPYTESEIKDFIEMTDFDWNKTDDLNDKDFETNDFKNITVTDLQYKIIEQAVEKLRKELDPDNEQDISIGRGLELICGDYIS